MSREYWGVDYSGDYRAATAEELERILGGGGHRFDLNRDGHPIRYYGVGFGIDEYNDTGVAFRFTAHEGTIRVQVPKNFALPKPPEPLAAPEPVLAPPVSATTPQVIDLMGALKDAINPKKTGKKAKAEEPPAP